MKAVGYTRVSKEEQKISGLGLADQENKIVLYCEMKGLDLLEIFPEEPVSGSKPLAERDLGGQLLDELSASKEPVCVVVLKLDRIFRNASDCLSTVEDWDKQGVSLHIIDLGGNSINTQTAAGKFMLTVLAGAAEMERNLVSERTKAALSVKKANGFKTGGSVPYGYDVLEGGKLVKNPDEWAVIEAMKELREGGETFEGIATLLNEQEITTKQGHNWVKASVYKVLNSLS